MPLGHHLMTTGQVADRLGVKPATVYAYVSRGLLASHRNADGKGSLFEKSEVDAFMAGRRRPTTPGIQTGVTLIRDGSLFYRGRDACVLARTASYEAVATLLWAGDLEHADLVPHEGLLTLAAQVIAPLPAAARTTDRLRVILAAAAAADPLRFDTTPAAVLATGRTMLATMVAALPRARSVRTSPSETTIAEVLWHRLTTDEPDYELLNAALILLADHDLAASTLAARVAASTRAHPYAVVSAGLAALDGPLHGAASGLAHAMLAEALASKDPVGTITERQREGRPVPGFGHPLYPDGDPRAFTLMEMIADGQARQTATRMIEVMRIRAGVHPNIDFSLATLALTHGMPPDAGEAVFAVGRTAGWLAHALEEYRDKPSRFRPNGQYSGRKPSA